jgi:hypothetical protein
LGQSTNQGALVGTITDVNGGVVPSVRIAVLNVETGIARTVTTDEQGNYRVVFLIPGNYRISAEQSGFNRVEANVVVHVSELKRVDLQLAPGDVNVSVTVSDDDVRSVNTDTPTIGQVIDERSIQNLPLNGREFIALAALVPGAETGNTKRGSVASRGVSVGFNGARAGNNAYYVDGADSTDVTRNQLISSPALDAIKEFRVETNLYSARYGRAGGGVINVVTKSGTNEFHGSLYEYHRNKALDASPYFDHRPYEVRAPYLFNQFGGTIGGPVTLPRFGEGGPALKSFRNQTFFFFSAEGYRQKKPGQLMETFAPTAKERAGDLSETINPFSGKKVVLRNPFTGQIIPDSKIPPELINPVGKRLMDLWPQPNYFGDPFLNLRLFRSGTSTQNKWLAKIDHHLSSKSTLEFSYNFGDYDNAIPDNTVFGDKDFLQHDRVLVASFTHVFSTNVVNDFLFNYTRFDTGLDFVLNDKNYANEFGLWTGKQNPDAKGSPRVLMYTVGYRTFQIGSSGPDVRFNRNYYAKDDLVWVKGKQTLSIGGDFKRQDSNWLINNATLGEYDFGILDGQPGLDFLFGVTGSTFAQLLMGVDALTKYDVSQGDASKLRRNTFGLYFQDDWRVSPRLTLNLGVRYDYEAPFSEISNRFLTLDYQTGLPRYAKGAPADLLSLLKFPFESDGPNRPFEPSKLDFSPRFGFAFRPFRDNKTAIRGGYGIVYTSENAYTTTYGSWVVPFSGTYEYNPKAFYWPDKQDHFVTIDKEPYGFQSRIGAHPGTFFPTTPEYPSGYVQQWNLTASREMAWGISAEVSYVGTRGVNLNGVTTLSSYAPSVDALVKKNVPGWPSIGLRTKGFNSKYNSFQAKATKRLSSGLSFIGAFTWAHALAEASNDDVNENSIVDFDLLGIFTKRTWSNADFDIRKRLTVSGIYELPVGRGQRFGQNWNFLSNSILGGWSLNYILTLQDGRPYSVRTAALNIPDRICNGNLPSGERTPERWYNPSCFVNHPAATVVDKNGVPRTIFLQGNASANIITGPGLSTLDFGLHKQFKLTEGARVEIRAEAFNIFNHPNLIGPSGNFFLNTPTGGRITSATDNRDIQVAIRLNF